MSYIIRERFINSKGVYFDNIREVACHNGELSTILGPIVGESGKRSGEIDDLNGVYVYRSKIEPDKAYRIYKDQIYGGIYSYRDEYFISELNKYGKDIKLSQLPTGIVTLDAKTIGQEIPYIEGPTLREYAKEEKKQILPTKIYVQILNIIKELYDKGIYYQDIHERNFKIKDGILGLIDWEEQYVKLGYLTESTNKLIFDYITMTLNELNATNNFNIGYEFEHINNFDDGYEKVLRLEEKLIREGYKK